MGMEEERWAESSEGWAWLLMSSGWELETLFSSLHLAKVGVSLQILQHSSHCCRKMCAAVRPILISIAALTTSQKSR